MARKKKYIPLPFETPKSSEHYTALYDSLLDSNRFKKLSNSARMIYIILKRQYKGDYTGNRVICPYKDFKEYGFNSTTTSRALKELESRGFIKIIRQGLTGGNLHRGATIYELINKWYMEE